MPVPPSGEQHAISSGPHRAVITEVGATVRVYSVDGRDVLEPFGVEEICDGAHGAPLIPWPNRLADGRYTWDGKAYQLPLSEPATRTAIHGLLRWRPWRVARRGPDQVVMAARLHPMTGYPFCLDVEVEYAVSAEGLSVTTTATNQAGTALPFGAGQHPYLSPGSGSIDACTLELDAALRIDTDERQLPRATVPVQGTEQDLRAPRRLNGLVIDHAFTDLGRDPQGRAWTRLGAPDRTSAELWVDETYRYVEIFTGDTLEPHRRRTALGVEPMTCPPNALGTGTDVLRIEPGGSVTLRWGARLA